MAYQYILFERSEGVGIVTLNRPEQLNSLTPAMLQELADVFRGMERDPLVRAIILTGAGKAFCGGEDLRKRAEGEFGASTPAPAPTPPPIPMPAPAATSAPGQPSFEPFSTAFNPDAAEGGTTYQPSVAVSPNSPQPTLANEFNPLSPAPQPIETTRPAFNPQPIENRSGPMFSHESATSVTPTPAPSNYGTSGTPASSEPLSEQVRRLYNPLIKQIRQLEKPVIAAVNGVAAGTGLGLALACDIRYAAERAKFVEVSVRVGLVPGGGTAFFLPRLIGLSRAMEVMFNGDEINATEALELGLVSKVLPGDQLAEEVRRVAGRMAKGPTRAIGLSKSLVYKTANATLDQALELEAYLTDEAARTQDYKEGLRSYLDKRPPNYRGS